MRSVLLCAASALLFAGCTLPPCFDCCPLLDPAAIRLRATSSLLHVPAWVRSLRFCHGAWTAD